MRRALLAVLALALWAPAAARAAWFPAEAIDGPSAAIAGLGGVDAARDGTGALVYLKVDAGAPHVFISRLEGGAWQPPARVDTAVGAPATAARVAAADGGVVIVAWVAGGTVYGMQERQPGQPGPAVALGSGTTVDADIGVDDAGWVVWGGAGDVHAASVRDGAWSILPQPLDMVAGDDAGGPLGPPRVAVGADGSALATWAEAEADGLSHVIARRLTPLMSIPPSDLTLPGGPASEPDPDIEDDTGFGWVVFRQDSAGTAHTFARRLLGATFDPPVPLDGGAASLTPSLDMSGDGRGEAVVAGGDGSVLWSKLSKDTFAAPVPIGGGAGPLAVASQREDLAAAWLVAGAVHARHMANGQPWEPEAALTAAAGGVVAPGEYAISADRVGDTVVAVAQGPDGARAIGAAVWDRPPSRPSAHTVTRFRSRGRPRFQWAPGLELWGPQTFQVQVDGRVVGTTTGTTLVPAQRISGGVHHWRVVAIDRRGQASPSAAHVLRTPATGLKVSVRVSGARRAGSRLRIVVRVRVRRGARLKRVTVSYGDGTRSTRNRVSTHRYRRAGTYKLIARAFDRSGNFSEKRVRLRIR